MTFWITGLVLAVLGVLPVVLTLWRGRDGGDAAPDLAIYRDQLREVERDLDRGVLSAEEAERTRTEVARRLLDADRTRPAPVGEAPRPARIAAAAGVGVGALAAAIGTYAWLGAPGYPDLPIAERLAQAEARRAERPSQAEAEARAEAAGTLPAPIEPEPEFAELMERLRSAMETRPDDAEGWRLLAQNEARLGNYAAAERAQDRRIALLGEDASAEEQAFLGELRVLAAGGFVTPEAESTFDAALALDRGNGRALYFKGLTLAQTGRPDLTLRIWAPLLEKGPEDAPWIAPIRAQIGQVAARAGIDYAMPPSTAPGPTEGDVAAAAEMTPEARQQMIEGMVARLGERLATEGGPAADWARLISALGVLGQTEKARSIAAEAQQVFANQPDDLAAIDAAARSAGVAP